MGAAELKEIARKAIDAFTAADTDALAALYAEDCVLRESMSPEPRRGIEAVKEQARAYTGAFPDLQMTIERQIAEGDTVVTVWTARGTHKGELAGIPPTGRQATTSGVIVQRIENGRIVEDLTEWNALGLLTQLGVIPEPAVAGTA
jgi:steroid delta-isomerase-like uncharacterized protein